MSLTGSGLATGQQNMAASAPVAIASDQAAFPVTATATLNAETTKVIGTVNVAAAQTIAVTNAGTFAVQSASTEADGANVTFGSKADAKSTATDTTAITAMQVLKQISASVQAPPSQAVTNVGTFAVQAAATLNAETTKVIGTINVAAAQTIAVTNAGTFAVQSAAPSITKATQGSTGYTVQSLVDAGRSSIMLYATGVASGLTTVETAITLTKSAGTAATGTGTSFVITSGKTFRITNITFASRGNTTAVAQSTVFSLRLNTGGAVTTSSTPILLQAVSATPAVANAFDRIDLDIPDGYEIAGNGTIQFGVTANSTFSVSAPTWDITIIGFEY